MCIWQTYFLAATILLLQSANLISHQKALSSFTPDVLLQALLKLSNLNKNLKNLFSSQDIKVWPVSVVDRYFRWTSSFIPSATNGVKDFSQKLPPTNMSCSTCIYLHSSWLWNTFQLDGQQDAPIQYGLKFGSSVHLILFQIGQLFVFNFLSCGLRLLTGEVEWKLKGDKSFADRDKKHRKFADGDKKHRKHFEDWHCRRTWLAYQEVRVAVPSRRNYVNSKFF